MNAALRWRIRGDAEIGESDQILRATPAAIRQIEISSAAAATANLARTDGGDGWATGRDRGGDAATSRCVHTHDISERTLTETNLYLRRCCHRRETRERGACMLHSRAAPTRAGWTFVRDAGPGTTRHESTQTRIQFT